MRKLSPEEIERYDRQILIPSFGIEAQLKLERSTVLVAGVGGLGSAASIYLAAAGIGRIRLVDEGEIELSNLNRQILYSTEDIGKPKVLVASKRLRALNPTIEVEAIQEKITDSNIGDFLEGVGVVVDGQDNFRTRFIINKACVERGKPFIYGAVYGLEGRLMTIIPGKTACLSCLIPTLPRDPVKIPTVGPVPGLVGALEALEAIKLITGVGEPFTNRLLIIAGEDLSFYTLEVKRDPKCQVCGGK